MLQSATGIWLFFRCNLVVFDEPLRFNQGFLNMQFWFYRLVQQVDDFNMCFSNTVANMVFTYPDTVIALFDLTTLPALTGAMSRATHLVSQEF